MIDAHKVKAITVLILVFLKIMKDTSSDLYVLSYGDTTSDGTDDHAACQAKDQNRERKRFHRQDRVDARRIDISHGTLVDRAICGMRDPPCAKCTDHTDKCAFDNIRQTDISVCGSDELHDRDLRGT